MAATAPAAWQTHANCRGLTDWFYRRTGEPQHEWERRARVAKTICGTCPVRQECLNAAIDGREPEGVWGGLDFPAEWRRAKRLAAEGRALIAARAAPYMPAVCDENDGWS